MTWLIDAGHGGLHPVSGKYTTGLSKMFSHDDFTIYEGVTNRAIAAILQEHLKFAGIEFIQIYHPYNDDSLALRMRIAKLFQSKFKSCALLSIHSNSSAEGQHGRGQGFEVFTSPGQDHSDPLARVFIKNLELYLPQFKMRSCLKDGDKDKEAKFTMLSGPMPSVLVELLFFDNKDEAKFLMKPEGQEKLAWALFCAILEIEGRIK